MSKALETGNASSSNESEPIFITCECCLGSAEELVYIRTDWTDGPQYDAKPCGCCDGFGTMQAEGYPITLEDLESGL